MGRAAARCTWRCSTRRRDDRASLSLDCPDGGFPSVGAAAPAGDPAGARRSAISSASSRDGAPDTAPWLDHGRWGVAPSARRAHASPAGPPPYAFLPAEGESLHQIPVGPVHAGIIEPGHFRFTANGETVVRLEERLGYVHKGIEGLMAGADARRAARLAGRTSGDSTVAYALRLRPRGRGGARHRGAAARAHGCAR